MKQLNQILKKYNFPRRKEEPKTVIGEIENIIHFKLPEDYKDYIINYEGFEQSIGQEYVRLWDFDELIQINKDYEIFDNLPKNLGIGTNGGGEFIALEQTDNDNVRVVLSPFIDLDRQSHIEIGTSFSDFLERLDKGQQWFQ